MEQNNLDKLLLKALGLESEALTPTQSIEDGLEAFFQTQDKRDWKGSISFDFVENSYWNPERQDDDKVWEWEVGLPGILFSDESKTMALTKVLLWAVKVLTEGEVEQLFKRKEKEA